MKSQVKFFLAHSTLPDVLLPPPNKTVPLTRRDLDRALPLVQPLTVWRSACMPIRRRMMYPTTQPMNKIFDTIRNERIAHKSTQHFAFLFSFIISRWMASSANINDVDVFLSFFRHSVTSSAFLLSEFAMYLSNILSQFSSVLSTSYVSFPT